MSRHGRNLWLLGCLLLVSCSGSTKNGSGPGAPPEPAELPRRAPGVHEGTASLPGGGTLRYTLSVPEGYDSKRPVPLVVALHYGGDVTPFYGRGMIDGLVG